jgi:hypothetical protein
VFASGGALRSGLGYANGIGCSRSEPWGLVRVSPQLKPCPCAVATICLFLSVSPIAPSKLDFSDSQFGPYMDRVFPESQLRCFVSGHDFQSGRKGPTKIRALAPGLFSGSSGAQAPKMLRERASLHEGHGFSRAIKGLPTTALAAEVRFSTHTGQSHLSPRLSSPADDWKAVPQRLKPSSGEWMRHG